MPKALLPEGNGGDVYPRVQVNGWGSVCGVCAVCKCVVAYPDQCTLALGRHFSSDACAQSHGSHWSTAPCVPRCTISAFFVVPDCVVLCTKLHCVWSAALLLWAKGSGRCNALPRRLMAVASGNRASHCRIAWEVVGGGTPSIHRLSASGQWASNSCNALPLRLEAVGIAYSRNKLPHRPGAVRSGTPIHHRLSARGLWAVELPLLLRCLVSLPGGSGERNPCIPLPHFLGAMGSETSAI